MSDPIAPPAPAAVDGKQTASNIAKGIQDRANGKGAQVSPTPPSDTNGGKPITPPDPNAGKEKYVVDGKEVWLTPEQSRAYVQKGISFEPKVDQLNRLQRESAQFVQAILDDPIGTLKNVAKQRKIPVEQLYEKFLEGDWPDQVKEIVGKKYYSNVIEPSRLTPEQLKAREDAKWRSERERQDATARDQQIKLENQQKFETAMNTIKANIAEAMKESGLPDNDTPLGAEMAWMVAKVMQLADKRRQPLTPKQAIEMVKNQRIRSVQAAYYDSLADKDDDGETLTKELGEKIVKKIQKFLLKQAKSNGAGGKPPVPPSQRPSVRNGVRQTITPDEFHEQLEVIKRGG